MLTIIKLAIIIPKAIAPAGRRNLNITEIDFEAENNNAEIEYELKDLYNINLFNLSPVLGKITIPDGTYDEVIIQ